jgi:uncharacterized protein (TIGR00369 family)
MNGRDDQPGDAAPQGRGADESDDLANAPFDRIAGETVVGLQKLIGHRLEAWQPGFCRIALALDDRHMNRFRGIHGGVFATLADAVGGFAGCYPDTPGQRRRCATVTLTTNFIGQPSDRRLVAEARLRRSGRSLFFSDIDIVDGEGTLVCTASGTYKYLGVVPQETGPTDS